MAAVMAQPDLLAEAEQLVGDSIDHHRNASLGSGNMGNFCADDIAKLLQLPGSSDDFNAVAEVVMLQPPQPTQPSTNMQATTESPFSSGKISGLADSNMGFIGTDGGKPGPEALRGLIEESVRKELQLFREDLRKDLREVMPRGGRDSGVMSQRLSGHSQYTSMSALNPSGLEKMSRRVSVMSSLKAPSRVGDRSGTQNRSAMKALKMSMNEIPTTTSILSVMPSVPIPPMSLRAEEQLAPMPNRITERSEAPDRGSVMPLGTLKTGACPSQYPSEAPSWGGSMEPEAFDRWMNAKDTAHVRSEMMEDWRRRNTVTLEETTTSCLAKVVESLAFDLFSSALILLNALTIGMQTDYMARANSRDVPEAYAILDKVFCALFTMELMTRILAYRWRFFCMPGWRWSVFDTLLVSLQLSEEVLTLMASGNEDTNMSFMRVLRILRLVRVFRIVRIIRLIEELRTIVISIINAMTSLFWTLVLLMLMIYVASLYFTQLVLDYRITTEDAVNEALLSQYYGEVGRSMLSLFQAITGGVDWDQLCSPLVENISAVHALVLCCYIAFTVLALMNVVTGVFVEGAMKGARREDEACLTENLRSAFLVADTEQKGTIDKVEFMQQIDNPKLQDLFNTMHIDSGEAHALFYALDVEDVGIIHYDDFVYGCLKLSGGARAIDMFTLLKEVQNLCTQVHDMSYRLSTHPEFQNQGLAMGSGLQQMEPPIISLTRTADIEDE